MRTEEETNIAIEKYSDVIRRICMLHLKNYADTEDVFQTVFIKYIQSSKVFENDEHEKAWFIRVTINACKDVFKSFFRTKTESLDALESYSNELSTEATDILQIILTLPEKYRRVIYLHFYEGYTAPEIGRILGKNANTVYTLISRAKKLLKSELAGEHNGK